MEGVAVAEDPAAVLKASSSAKGQQQLLASTAAASPSSNTNTGAALSVEVPAQLPAVDVSCNEQQQDVGCGGDGAEGECRSPASPLNIHSLLNRPFGDVMREITSGFQLKSTALVAAEQLRYLVFHRDHDQDELGSPALIAALLQQVREAPGLPAGGSCMAVLAQLARTADGRAQLRAERVLLPVLRFLSMPEVLQKANADPALMLLQNASCDKLCRQSIIKAGGIELMLQLLSAAPLPLKQQQPKLAAYLTGTLLNLVAGDGEASPAKHMFVKAGGLQKACQVLADWGRYDCSPATMRLRLLLADLGRLQQYADRLHQTALDASLSARTGGRDHAGSSGGSETAGAVAGQLLSSRSVVITPEMIAMAGKGIPLGTPRMPASERLTAVVLQHGKDNHNASSNNGDEET